MKAFRLGGVADPSLATGESFISGRRVAAAATFPAEDPATGETLAGVANLGAAEIADLAIHGMSGARQGEGNWP